MAQAGVASRRKCEELIAAGRVRVNGAVASVGCVVDPARDAVTLDDEPLVPQTERVVIAFHKPRGVVSTSSDPQGRRTVANYFTSLPYRVCNVGRLDIDSEGLLLITNDGDLANRLTHPRYHVKKTYLVICRGALSMEERRALERGVMLEDGVTAPALVRSVKLIGKGNTSFLITIREGKNRQVRRMLQAVGHDTLRLRRLSVGPVSLGDLAPGEWRFLTGAELEKLLGQPEESHK